MSMPKPNQILTLSLPLIHNSKNNSIPNTKAKANGDSHWNPNM